jgi:hypothetical protein
MIRIESFRGEGDFTSTLLSVRGAGRSSEFPPGIRNQPILWLADRWLGPKNLYSYQIKILRLSVSCKTALGIGQFTV